MAHKLQTSYSSWEVEERLLKDLHESTIVLQLFNWLIRSLSDLGSSFACLRGFASSGSLEFNFDILLNVISGFFPF